MKHKKATKILVIEDYDAIRALMYDILTEHGYYVEAAANGSEGLALFTNNTYDMVLIDLIMPDISGWELAEKIKSMSRNTPIALITGWPVKLTLKELRSKGFDLFISKPFRDEQLQKLVTDGVRMKQKLSPIAL